MNAKTVDGTALANSRLAYGEEFVRGKQYVYAVVSTMSEADIIVSFPSRWTFGTLKQTHTQTIKDLDNLGKILLKGCEAVAGVYMRICDTIRTCQLSDGEVRATLKPYFPDPRISEILRVSRAPEAVYSRYTAGFFGFKAALKRCRLYTITPNDELKRRQAKRAAARLLDLIGSPGEIKVRDHLVRIT